MPTDIGISPTDTGPGRGKWLEEAWKNVHVKIPAAEKVPRPLEPPLPYMGIQVSFQSDGLIPAFSTPMVYYQWKLYCRGRQAYSMGGPPVLPAPPTTHLPPPSHCH